MAVDEVDVAQMKQAGDDGEQLAHLLLVEAARDQGVEQQTEVGLVVDLLCGDALRLPQQREGCRLQAAELQRRALCAARPC